MVAEPLRFHKPNETSRARAATLHTKEPATIAWIDAMERGSVLWDIGANIGIYSIYAASKGIDVVAVEPDPQHFAELCANVRLNGLEDRVTLVCCALDDYCGANRFGGQKVPVMGMDDLADLIYPSPTHIKIDTDGCDARVLEGGELTLEGAQHVIVEVDESRPDAVRIRHLMQSAGFVQTGRHVCPFTPQSPIGMDHWHRL